jgi:hypothetical protein
VRKSKIRRPMATEEEARVTIRHGGHSGRSTHPLCKHPEWPSNAEYMQDFDNMSKKTVREHMLPLLAYRIHPLDDRETID